MVKIYSYDSRTVRKKTLRCFHFLVFYTARMCERLHVDMSQHVLLVNIFRYFFFRGKKLPTTCGFRTNKCSFRICSESIGRSTPPLPWVRNNNVIRARVWVGGCTFVCCCTWRGVAVSAAAAVSTAAAAVRYHEARGKGDEQRGGVNKLSSAKHPASPSLPRAPLLTAAGARLCASAGMSCSLKARGR